MRRCPWVQHSLTGVLTLLVLISFTLSYLIWQGGWPQAPSEVGFAEPTELSVSQNPQDDVALDPYEIITQSRAADKYGVALPTSPLYNEWLERLATVDVFQVQVGGSTVLPATADSVEANFGVVLKRKALSGKVPSLQTTFQVEANQITFYQTGPTDPVKCILTSPNYVFQASTDMNPRLFHQFVNKAMGGAPWVRWGSDSSNVSLVPFHSVQMVQSEWRTTTPPLIPLVNSFFLNPQVASRFQSNPFTEIWTDGSRAVTMNQTSSRIIYDDPNTTGESNAFQDELEAAFSFVRDHGGSPKTSITFLNGSQSDTPNSTTYTLRQYQNGYPILSSIGDYDVQVTSGHITQYDRPISTLSTLVSTKNVKIMGFSGLMKALTKLAPASPPQSYDVELGYSAEANSSGTVTLIPSYTVTLRQVALWTIDAKTGQVLQGMGKR